jgi:hypothetical protein
MKISLELSGPAGKMWTLEMRYHALPPEYLLEIASTCRSYLTYITNTPGGAASGDRQYTIEFAYQADERGPKAAVPPEYAALFTGAAEAEHLLYSQAVAIQDAGIELLQKLQQGAHMEITSGQRQ